MIPQVLFLPIWALCFFKDEAGVLHHYGVLVQLVWHPFPSSGHLLLLLVGRGTYTICHKH
jgi:hypothetical protein